MPPANLCDKKREDRVGRRYDIGPKFVDERLNRGCQFCEHRTHAFNNATLAEQFENNFPSAGVTIDRRRVTSLHELVDDGVCPRIRVGNKDFRGSSAFLQQCIPYIAGGSVMALTHAGSENENARHHPGVCPTLAEKSCENFGHRSMVETVCM